MSKAADNLTGVRLFGDIKMIRIYVVLYCNCK